tara:strand:+ start:138 stop:1292 length:1155 start_codon:yes stop_codon:yes gene_type:complete
MKIIIKKITIILFIFFANSNLALHSSEKIKLGLLIPITGPNSEIGKSIIKATRMAINKINDPNFEVIPKDTGSNPEQTLIAANEFREQGVKIVIGPVFQDNLIYLNQLNDMTFLSLTNKNYNNPKNVLSAGINADSQMYAINNFLKNENLSKTLILIPENNYKKEIELAIKNIKIKYKKKFYYDTSPTKITKQIQKFTNYNKRKQYLIDEINRVENSQENNKEKKIEQLKKKDTLGKVGFDSIVICDFDENLISIATSLLYSDVSSKKLKFITLNQWFDPKLVKEKTIHPLYFPSINQDQLNEFKKKFNNSSYEAPTHLSLISYDLIGLVYYLTTQNDFIVDRKIFKKKDKFKGIIGTFEIDRDKITHILNFYETSDLGFKKIF